jgi:hypothetical protein
MIIPETLKIQFKTIPDVYKYAIDFGYIDTAGVYTMVWVRQGIRIPGDSTIFPDTVPYS